MHTVGTIFAVLSKENEYAPKPFKYKEKMEEGSAKPKGKTCFKCHDLDIFKLNVLT